MGAVISLTFMELRIEVSLYDPSQDTVTALLGNAKEIGLSEKLHPQNNYGRFAHSFGSVRGFFLNLPYGEVQTK